MNPLQTRLAVLRRRLRLVVSFRVACWVVTLVLAAGLLAGWLDWRLHLPALVRAAFLAATLAGAGALLIRFLVRPLATRCDDLSLALRVEALYPWLKDALASSVQFLEPPRQAEHLSSADLRRRTVEATLGQVRELDFAPVVSTRGLRRAGLCAAATGACALGLLLLRPGTAWTALERLANPFGARPWPLETQLDVQAADRVARGDPFEVRGAVWGVLPLQATVEYDGISPARQTCPVLADKDGRSGSLVARRERVDHSFRFRVRANDAVSTWREVAVLPPPALAPLEGRPSPLVSLRYPAYTDLPAQDLPDGSGNVEAVAGTLVRFRAATDRPVARAWIEYRPEPPQLRAAACLAPVAADSPLGLAAACAGGQTVLDNVPVRIGADGRGLRAEFVPRVSGMYAVCFEDASGLGGTRLFDLRVFADPAPAVTLERPSRGRDSLDVLPDAEVTVQVVADDPQFGLRSVWLEYRCRKGDLPRGIPLSNTPAAAGAANPKPPRLQIGRRLALGGLRHLDGAPLREGDVVTLQALADDFDDVAVDKLPGHSHEVELRVISRSALEILLNEAQSLVQQELVRVRKLQQEALRHVTGAEQQWRDTGRLRERDLDTLMQAEQLQQQVRGRIGNPQEGLRADVSRILQTLRDNRVRPSGTHDRMATVAAELERLALNDLESIEPRLTGARKEQETAARPRKPAAGEKGLLGEARRHQEEVENTLGELLKLLEPWGSVNEVKGEARSLLQQQRRAAEETRKLDKETTRGQDRQQLEADDQAALDRAAAAQKKLAERTAELLGKMERVGQDRQAKDAATAQALKDAAARGRREDVAAHMQNAAQSLRANQLGEAAQAQQKATQALQQVVQALEESRENELDQLRKKLKEVEDRMADLAGRQEGLRRKAQQAARIADPEERRRELQRLSREQGQLRQEAAQLVRELTRLRAERAGQALREAGGRMEQAARQLTRGEEPDQPQEEALQRLNDARRTVAREQQAAQDELAREKLAKVTDEVKRLKERQEAALAEAARLRTEALQKKGWDRGLLFSLTSLAEAQKDLGQDAEGLAKGRLAPAQVFARILARSADAMKQAAEQLQDEREQAVENPEEPKRDGPATQSQRAALHRLGQLLEAMKPERGAAARATPPQEGKSRPGQAGPRESDGLGDLAQLKALRLLQQDVNERTVQFDKAHPDAAKLTAQDRRQLEALRDEQSEIAGLLDELTKPANAEGSLR
jgi:hypothetical protein